MKKIILALLVGFTITANAQTYTTIAQLTAKVKADSLVQAKRIAMLETTVKQQANTITTLLQQSTNYANSIKDLNTGRMPIDFNYFDSTGGTLKTKPVDFSLIKADIKAVNDKVDKIPIVDPAKLQAAYDWQALAKTIFLTLSK